jgi:hypothetical protein
MLVTACVFKVQKATSWEQDDFRNIRCIRKLRAKANGLCLGSGEDAG